MVLKICVGLGFALTLATQHKLLSWPVVEPPAADTQPTPDESEPTKRPLSFENVGTVVATPPRWACESREQFDIARFVDLVSRPSITDGGDQPADSLPQVAPAFASLSCRAALLRFVERRVVAAAIRAARSPQPARLPQVVRTGPPARSTPLV